MNIIARYETKDGRTFKSENEAVAHETLLDQIDEALIPLGSIHPKVENGKGWVQHNEAAYRKVQLRLVELARPLFKGYDKLEKAANETPEIIYPSGLLGWIIDDSDSPLRAISHRLLCIDAKFREHQQPYFAINGPDKDHVCVEDRS